MPPRQLSIFHPAALMKQQGNLFGKDVANAGLFKALASFGGYEQIHVLHQTRYSADQIADGLYPSGAHVSSVTSAPLHSTTAPSLAGHLLRGQPYLAELAWNRSSADRSNAYSLIGLIHTIAPPAIREMIGGSMIAPVEAWDALICTSPAVQSAMHAMFDDYAHYLEAHLGASRSVRPQLPLIPLGTDVESIASDVLNGHHGKLLRSQHGINASDLIVLWVGRLSYYEKAFPQPMFRAVELAAQRQDQQVHFLMAGWFPGGDVDRQLYQQAAAAYAPSVRVHFLDGNNIDVIRGCWSAADVFLSLVDNIQETFGLTPIEAMAAGLPVIASDWDGYSYTIRHEQDGFLIPTLSSKAPRMGDFLANLHALGLESYQTYVGAVAQHTAVDIEFAASCLTRLLGSKELRQKMGASAQERARQHFSWPTVVAQYNALFDELTQIRHAAQSSSEPCPVRHPLRGHPFKDFEHFASMNLSVDHRVALSMSFDPAQELVRLQSVRLNQKYPGLRLDQNELLSLIDLLAARESWLVGDLQQQFPEPRSEAVTLTLVWLAKLGMLQWS